MPYCTKCGKEAKPGSSFCTGCGAPIRKMEPPSMFSSQDGLHEPSGTVRDY